MNLLDYRTQTLLYPDLLCGLQHIFDDDLGRCNAMRHIDNAVVGKDCPRGFYFFETYHLTLLPPEMKKPQAVQLCPGLPKLPQFRLLTRRGGVSGDGAVTKSA
jgi:hypothetical protein